MYFILVAFNDTEISAAEIGNEYLNSVFRKYNLTAMGANIFSDKGKLILIFRSLYEFKRSGSSWRSMLYQSLQDLDHK